MHIKALLVLFIFFLSPLAACQIIYLNGTSSVGKSTLAKALQDKLETPYMRIGIDQIIQMMPEKVNNWEGGKAELGFSWETSKDSEGRPLQILRVGPYAKKMPQVLRQVAAALARCGERVIIDDVAMEPGSFQSWKSALKDYQVLWIGLTAPIDVIEEREKARGDRQIGQARAAYNLVHQGFCYDLFFDTNEISIEEMVKKIQSACEGGRKD